MILSSALTCLALNIYHESRGEPTLGKIAVAQTTINRSVANGTTVCDEVLKPKQFSWTSHLVHNKRLNKKGYPNEREAWEESQRIARMALNNQLNTPHHLKGVVAFHATSIKPYWAKHLRKVGTVGNHVFYALPKNRKKSI